MHKNKTNTCKALNYHPSRTEHQVMINTLQRPYEFTIYKPAKTEVKDNNKADPK